jgi:Rps23 Pro-64 3,4-dihydroxylase Tpa1-like proline 4-hydroxylase
MILHANIDDLALIIRDFLPEDLYKKVLKYNFNTKDLKSSYGDWHEDLYEDNKKNKTMNYVKTLARLAHYEKGKFEEKNIIFKNVIETIIKCEWLPFQKKSAITLNYYEYDKYSGINWHEDKNHTLNYSLYIHDQWDRNWGGETLIDTGRGLPLAVYPVPNSLVVIKNDVPHKVCPVTGPKKRKVLQTRGWFYN